MSSDTNSLLKNESAQVIPRKQLLEVSRFCLFLSALVREREYGHNPIGTRKLEQQLLMVY